VFNLFIMVFIFQIFLITQVKLLYLLLKILFTLEIILAIPSLVKLSIKKKIIIFAVLFMVVIRVPFYFYSDGLISTSDNALDALQCEEIRNTHTVPFFQLENLKHNGTIKFLFVAFLWDFFGSEYLYFVLFQLLIYTAFLILIYEIFKPLANRTSLALLVFTGFAFMEIVFNYSLSLRGGTYLEMFLLLFLGVYLFDFKYSNTRNMLLSYYFIIFAIYIHPIAILFALSFILCTTIYAFKNHKIIKNFAVLLGGVFAGGFHYFYYLFFMSKPTSSGSWEKMNIIPLSNLSPQFFLTTLKKFKVIFWNIFSLETSYLLNFFEGIRVKEISFVLNRVLIYFSLMIFVIGIILVSQKLLRIILKKEKFVINQWPYIFFVSLLSGFAIKLIVLNPSRLEPRHNFDLVFVLILSYIFAFSSLFKTRKKMPLKAALTLFLLLLFTFPHYFHFLKMTRHKNDSYHEVLSVLSENRVKYLATDFIIAYIFHFLSHRRTLVSDSLGPLTIPLFYPEMREKVDKIPGTRKAYLLFSPTYPARQWHKDRTKRIKKKTLKNLKKENCKYRTYKFKDYLLIIPSQKQFRKKRTSD
jgi:hypothetical protein